MTIIYTKTADGQREIETRARRLTPRARSLLILIDGKRAHEELATLVQQLDETLATLLEAGLVATVNSESTPSSTAKPASAAPQATRKAATEDFATLRRAAVRAVNDQLGPSGEALAMRLERAADANELHAALERAVTYIANARGGGAAAEFAGRFLTPPAA
jgi:septal ring-binding cell division protein DamX